MAEEREDERDKRNTSEGRATKIGGKERVGRGRERVKDRWIGEDRKKKQREI